MDRKLRTKLNPPLKLRDSAPEDIPRIALRLREDDIRELRDLLKMEPLQAVGLGILGSNPAYTVEDEDGPTACFGIFPGDAPGVGHIWALGSGAIDRHPVAFARLSRDLVRQAPEWGYLVLGNVMDASNAHRLKWLDRLGFRIYRYIDIGPNGAYEFIKTL